MFKRVLLKTVLLIASLYAVTMAQETITFPSNDGLEISADVYIADPNKDTAFIVLFHQAGWSRGEYLEIAPKLNALGFNVMAVDQRSGGAINDVNNESTQRAEE